jgi:hypothetical protein
MVLTRAAVLGHRTLLQMRPAIRGVQDDAARRGRIAVR